MHPRRWYLVRLWRASPAAALLAAALIAGQARCTADGVIRFPFVHWWMYSAPFTPPDSVRVLTYVPRGGEGPAPRLALKRRELLELQATRAAGEGHGDAAARAWMAGNAGRALAALGPAADRWRVRILPDPPPEAFAAWARRAETAWLPEGWTLEPLDTVLHRQPASGRYAP
jgi:hypothetical protein